ncbi:hypothetical protein [Paraburkholderia hospita]|uniref:hypothetical protein n=1 Tax=Paraburkholderia hospita TaxID=169430 RepID=UPI001FCA154A|nr:hypothetical protein [Paraburkholderia hospita]
MLPYPLSKDEALMALNTEIMLRLQEAGIVALSDTTVHGAHCLPVAIATTERRDDLDLLVKEIVRLGHQILSARRSV